jgi:hypothetical protein
MHDPATNSNFCDEHGNAIKPKIIQDYNHHLGSMDREDRMVENY